MQIAAISEVRRSLMRNDTTKNADLFQPHEHAVRRALRVND